jgi:hypothetical protein
MWVITWTSAKSIATEMIEHLMNTNVEVWNSIMSSWNYMGSDIFGMSNTDREWGRRGKEVVYKPCHGAMYIASSIFFESVLIYCEFYWHTDLQHIFLILLVCCNNFSKRVYGMTMSCSFFYCQLVRTVTMAPSHASINSESVEFLKEVP